MFQLIITYDIDVINDHAGFVLVCVCVCVLEFSQCKPCMYKIPCSPKANGFRKKKRRKAQTSSRAKRIDT
jgi:hypothetical protein